MCIRDRHPDRAARRPEPAPHERYLVDTGFHWGEWLVPGEEIDDFPAWVTADKGDVATAYFAHSGDLMARIAAVLGRDDEAARYRELAGHERAEMMTHPELGALLEVLVHAAEIPTNVPISSTDRPPVAWTSTSSRAPSSGWVIITARSWSASSR